MVTLAGSKLVNEWTHLKGVYPHYHHVSSTGGKSQGCLLKPNQSTSRFGSILPLYTLNPMPWDISHNTMLDKHTHTLPPPWQLSKFPIKKKEEKWREKIQQHKVHMFGFVDQRKAIIFANKFIIYNLSLSLKMPLKCQSLFFYQNLIFHKRSDTCLMCSKLHELHVTVALRIKLKCNMPTTTTTTKWLIRKFNSKIGSIWSVKSIDWQYSQYWPICSKTIIDTKKIVSIMFVSVMFNCDSITASIVER